MLLRSSVVLPPLENCNLRKRCPLHRRCTSAKVAKWIWRQQQPLSFWGGSFSVCQIFSNNAACTLTSEDVMLQPKPFSCWCWLDFQQMARFPTSDIHIKGTTHFEDTPKHSYKNTDWLLPQDKQPCPVHILTKYSLKDGIRRLVKNGLEKRDITRGWWVRF